MFTTYNTDMYVRVCVRTYVHICIYKHVFFLYNRHFCRCYGSFCMPMSYQLIAMSLRMHWTSYSTTWSLLKWVPAKCSFNWGKSDIHKVPRPGNMESRRLWSSVRIRGIFLAHTFRCCNFSFKIPWKVFQKAQEPRCFVDIQIGFVQLSRQIRRKLMVARFFYRHEFKYDQLQTFYTTYWCFWHPCTTRHALPFLAMKFNVFCG